jgi:photosystem II stability/assembly factor-like uncharacterized protein
MWSSKINIIILFISITIVSKAQNWSIIDTSVTHTNAALRNAFFTDDSTGYIVGGWGGSGGVILKTQNAGLSWSLKTSTSDLQCVFFPSKNIGYAVGEGATIMKTEDAGATWFYQWSNVPSLFTAKAVCFINNDTGFISLINGAGYAFLKTYNGGANWINDVSDTVFATSFSVVNDSTIYAIQNTFSKTFDGGSTWISSPIPSDGRSEYMFFINETKGFATMNKWNGDSCFNYSSLIRTNDAGQTWQETNYNCDWVMGIDFPNSQIGYMVGGWVSPSNAQKVWKTSDGGDTWQFTTFQIDPLIGEYIICTDINTCYVLTNAGIIVKTTNGFGNVWIFEQINSQINFEVYPNPTTNQIIIEFDLNEIRNTSIEINNILGQRIKNINNGFATGKNKIEVDLHELSNGIYYIRFQNEGRIMSKKIVKE